MNCSELCENFKPKIKKKNINVAIIVGHTKIKQGATAYNGESEYIFNSKAAYIIVERLKLYGINAKVFFRDDGGLYGCAHDIKEHFETVDLTFELHFNAYKKVAFGTECLIADKGERHQDKRKCHEFADILTDRFSEIYRMRERHDDGVKTVEKGDRGEYNLRIMHKVTKAPVALLFEPCFMNIKNRESEQIIERPGDYAANVADIIAFDMFGVIK